MNRYFEYNLSVYSILFYYYYFAWKYLIQKGGRLEKINNHYIIEKIKDYGRQKFMINNSIKMIIADLMLLMEGGGGYSIRNLKCFGTFTN